METPNHQQSILIEELYRRLQPELVVYASRFTPSVDAAKDVVEDVFYAMLKRGEHVRQDGNLKSYLYASVYHKCLNSIAHQKSHLAYVQWYGLNGLKSAWNGNHCGLEELQAVIDGEKNSLPTQCKTIFQLSRDDGLTHKQIALKLGLSVKTIENQMTIALRRLHQAVDEYLGNDQFSVCFKKNSKKK